MAISLIRSAESHTAAVVSVSVASYTWSLGQAGETAVFPASMYVDWVRVYA